MGKSLAPSDTLIEINRAVTLVRHNRMLHSLLKWSIADRKTNGSHGLRRMSIEIEG